MVNYNEPIKKYIDSLMLNLITENLYRKRKEIELLKFDKIHSLKTNIFQLYVLIMDNFTFL